MPRRVRRSEHAELSSIHIFTAIAGISSDGSGAVLALSSLKKACEVGDTCVSGTGKWTGPLSRHLMSGLWGRVLTLTSQGSAVCFLLLELQA